MLPPAKPLRFLAPWRHAAKARCWGKEALGVDPPKSTSGRPAKQDGARPDESLPDKWQAGVRTGAGPTKSTSGKQRRLFDLEKKRGDYGENKQGLHNTVNKKRITGIPEKTYINEIK